MQLQEVSRVHSTSNLSRGKGQIQSRKKLHPQYVIGFIDGEGSFSVSIYRDEKEHLKLEGVEKILKLRDKIRALGKKHRLETTRIRENRSSSGVGR